MEREKLYSEHLRDWTSRSGVAVALFDFDDTLIYTHRIFSTQIGIFLDVAAAECPHLTPDEMRNVFNRINTNSFVNRGVQISEWTQRVEEFINEVNPNNPQVLRNGLFHLYSIYTSVPELIPGAELTLKSFNNVGVRLGLVTHADRKWTDFKLGFHDLRRYFEHIYIVSDSGHKTHEEWNTAVEAFNIEASRVLVTGDNLKGDILAARKAGVQKLAWIQSDSSWSLYQEGEAPDDVVVIRSISELIPALVSK